MSGKYATYTIKWSYTIIWQVRVVKIKLRNCVNIFDGRKPVPEKNSMYNKKAQIKSLKYPIMIVHWQAHIFLFIRVK